MTRKKDDTVILREGDKVIYVEKWDPELKRRIGVLVRKNKNEPFGPDNCFIFDWVFSTTRPLDNVLIIEKLPTFQFEPVAVLVSKLRK